MISMRHCTICRRFDEKSNSCAAYPDGIPDRIKLIEHVTVQSDQVGDYLYKDKSKFIRVVSVGFNDDLESIAERLKEF